MRLPRVYRERMRTPAEIVQGMTFAGRFQVGCPGPPRVHTAVFTALDLSTGLEVVLEVTKTSLPADFEASLGARPAAVRHPNVASFVASGWDPATGAGWCVMESASGPTLAEVVAREGPLAPARALPLARQILAGLDAVGSAGEWWTPSPHEAFVEEGAVERIRLVASRDWLGSYPGFTGYSAGLDPGTACRPPETLDSGARTAASSVYAAGACLHFMLAGAAPFDGRTTRAMLLQVLSAAPPPLSKVRAGISPGLETVVLEALAKDPARRPATPRDLALRLRMTS